MKIWALTDGKPGHKNQTAGLIQALSRYREVETCWISALSVTKVLRLLFTRSCDDVCAGRLQRPDLIIAAGHKTHLGLLALQRACGGRSVVLMRPSLPLGLFDLCLIPRHDKPPKRDNVIQTMGALNKVVAPDLAKSPQGLILLGGESRHFSWDTQVVLDQITCLLEQQPELHWTIATSRRTPLDSVASIQQRFPDVSMVLPESVGEDWLPGKISQARYIWVTGDSISMIYEALTAGAKTGLIELKKQPKETRVASEIKRLIAEQRVMTRSSSKLGDFEPLNEAVRCARLLLEKFNL